MFCSTYSVKSFVIYLCLLAAAFLLTCGQKTLEPENSTPPIPVEARFGASDTSGTPPLTVQFSDSSSGSPDFWFWRFGDGQTSFEQNPSHQYADNGIYDVILLVSRGEVRDSLIRSGLIHVDDSVTAEPPVAQFVGAPLSGPAPLTVLFTNQSNGTITSVEWSFGDGTSAASTSPLHEYTTPGTYSVRLIVNGPGGSDTLIRLDYINVTIPPPTAAFSAHPTTGQPPLTVNFTNLSTGNITSFKWYFGDGDSSDVRNPSHSYESAGLYSVTLIAIGPGGEDTTSILDYVAVSAGPPIAAFTGNPTSGIAPLSVQFTNNSAGSISGYEWDFGDGGTSTLANPTHQYVSAGIYSVSLIVTGPGGADTTSRTDYITVQSAPPVADFSGAPTSGLVPLTVNFTNLSTGDITGYLWSFGDGQTSTLANPSHQYSTGGSYTVRLTTTGPGGTDTLTRTDYITATWPAPTAAFSADPTSGVIPFNVTFTNNSSGQISSYAWDFGDGGTSIAANPTHNYTVAGTYSVRLIVTGPGGVDTLLRQNYITASWPRPTAGFTGLPTQGTVPFAVNFTNTSSGQITSYAWDFGDGGTSTAQTPSHTYTVHGTYSVRLIVTGPGGVDTLLRPNYITANAVAPTAEFTANPTSGNIPLVVQFTDLSTGNITSWNWRFGTTITSAVRNPSITFSNPGTYDVRLIVSGPGGIDTLIRAAYINALPPPPIADFSGTPTSGVAPLAVSFTNQSTGTFTTFAWDFGDGGTSDLASPTHEYSIPGVYDVRLIVIGPGGADTLTRVQYITVDTPPPVADFSANPTSGVAPLSVQFTSLATGEIDVYQWSFGDGTTSNLQNPSHTYIDPGQYDVRLIVIGPGGEDTLIRASYIQALIPPPTAVFEGTPTSGPAPLAVQFNSLSTGVIDSYLWSFGDGDSTFAQNPLHIYTAPGRYTVRLTVTGPGGSNSAQRGNYIQVLNPPPTADFTVDQQSGVVPLIVNFTAITTGAVSTYAWDFGDGGTSTLQNPSHQYTTAGVYSVRLTVDGPDGSNSTLKTNFITVLVPPPTADFSADPVTGVDPLQVTFTNSSTGQIDKYLWDFGDGNGSEEQNPVHTYQNPGTYSVSLTVSGPGGEDTLVRQDLISVESSGPFANFDASPTSGIAPLLVQFNNMSSGVILTSFWDFGDGQTSVLTSPQHEYLSPGTYTVRLIVVGALRIDTLTRTDYIVVNEPPPVAAFTASTTSGLAPLDVQFTSQSTGAIDSYLWDFGDGNTSVEQNPLHQYQTQGLYTVRLIVTGPGGSDTLEIVDYITVLSIDGGGQPVPKTIDRKAPSIGDQTPRKE